MGASTKALAIALALHSGAAEFTAIEAPTSVSVDTILDEGQREFANDPSSTIAWLAGRRRGKSIGAAARMVIRTLADARRRALYVSLTRKAAKQVMWEPLRWMLRKAKIPHSVNLTELVLRIQGGGMIMLGGAGTDDEIEKYRGLSFDDVETDECGAWPSLRLGKFKNSIIKPALADRRGAQAFLGTPGPVLHGFWFDMTGPNRTSTIPLYSGTILDNPFIPDPAEFLQEVLEENSWTEDHPTFRREYLAEWIEDLEALVFPFVRERNGVDCLPQRTGTGVYMSPDGWRYAIGVDVGQRHATAISVVACHHLDPHDYIVHSEKHKEMLVGQLEHRLKEIKKLYRAPTVDLDTGGMGAQHAAELTRVFGMGITNAEKTEKESTIQIWRDRLIAGRLKVLEGQCAPLLEEWASLMWDDKARMAGRRMPHPDQDDDASDSALYALRRLKHYRKNEPVPPPEPGTEEHAKQETQRMLENLRRRLKPGRKKRNRPAWDR